MSERPRRRSRRDAMDSSSSFPTASTSTSTTTLKQGKGAKRFSKPSKERWLLTRKTWRYMADAGRRLIPDGTHNRPEDIPKIEQYFQQVCQKEPKFLLWRKSSYPGTTLGSFRCARKRHRLVSSCRAKAPSSASADEAEIESLKKLQDAAGKFDLHLTGESGRFDLTRVKKELLATGVSSTPSSPSSTRYETRGLEEDAEARVLADMLRRYLNLQKSEEVLKPCFDHRSLVEKLQRHLDSIVPSEEGRFDVPRGSASPYEGDFVHKSLIETLSRYYSKSPTREHVMTNILTDRKLLEKLYFDLRCTRGFRTPVRSPAGGTFGVPSDSRWLLSPTGSRTRTRAGEGGDLVAKDGLHQVPPLISVQEPSTDRGLAFDQEAQTDAIPKETLDGLLLELKEREEKKSDEDTGQRKKSSGGRRRSSVDNDDVSPSVSSTIKRYLRMARKKSVDSDKADRFKRVNYDRNLRNIKPKGNFEDDDDDERNKSCQTEDGVQWIWDYCQNHSVSANFERDYGVSDVETSGNPSRNASSRSSIDAGIGSEEPPSTPKHHQSFLSHFLHGSSNVHRDKDKSYSAPGSPALNATNSNAAGGTTMQKSKSSSNVVHHGSRLVAKKIWKSRSKSTSRAANLPAACWTPQGKCTWAGTGGRRVTLQDIPLRALTEVERKVLCRVAVAKLQALNLGVHIRPPAESLTGGSIASKPKRRPYLLKRKAITTGLFDNRSKDDKQDKESSGGLVFGIPLSQCIENERLARISVGEVPEVGTLRRSSGHGSRTSFSSLIESPTTVSSKTDEGGSSESISSKGGGVGVLTGSDSGVLELTSDNTCEYDAVPAIVRQCIRHLETNGLSTLGVFRVSPSKKRVRQLREDFDFGRETKIGPDQCPHDVAALLKEYFRDLPDPLLCRDLYQAFVHTQKIRNRRLQQEALQHLIQLLPTTNRETLWVLLNFLTQVAAHSEDHKNETGEPVPGNKMDITNLATVFAPNILHCVKPGQVRPEVSVERAEERIDVINVVRTLLEHASTLFTVPAALLDELYLHMMDSHPAELDLALSRRAEEQSTDDLDHCSEAEIYPVDAENLPLAATTSSTTSTTTSSGTTTTTTRKVWTREECLHQSAGVGGDIGPKPRRPKRPGTRRSKIGESNRSNSVDSGSSEDPVEARRKSSPMVITASLTIPMSGAFTLNLDDPDIPYIEESLKQPSAPPRRQRQRSISGCSEGGRHGSDSAVGSSATLSWDQIPSSPPSWASSPPASPDSAVTAVSYIPELQTSSSSAAILQRISFNNSSSVDQQGTTVQRQSTGASARMTPTQEVSSVNPPYTPSITSIGGAVMRSKTADIERILHIGKPELASTTSSTVSKNVTSSETKKYTKRRYTDSRHQTRHIPDAESLITTSSSLSLGSSSTSTTTITNANALSSSSSGRSAPVWKRRELISSAPKDRQGFL